MKTKFIIEVVDSMKENTQYKSNKEIVNDFATKRLDFFEIISKSNIESSNSKNKVDFKTKNHKTQNNIFKNNRNNNNFNKGLNNYMKSVDGQN